MRPRQSPGAIAKRVLEGLRPILARINPDMVVVQGDTTTAAAAALSAFEAGIPVAHVEAGLRSFDVNDPYPEENNRILIDAVSSLLFPPTPAARANLKKENLAGRLILTTGNTVVDALRSLPSAEGAAPKLSRHHEVLVTLHRREIHGKPLKSIYRCLLKLVNQHENLLFVYPVHPNPLICRTAKRMLQHPRIRLLPPLPYREFLAYLRRCLFVITDSGGVQEESFVLKKPVLVVRANTERPEILSSGIGVLTGLDPALLFRWTSRLLKDPALRARMSRARHPYGNGRASDLIARAIARWASNPQRAVRP